MLRKPRPHKPVPQFDYPELKPQPWKPNRPCAGCGAPPESFVRTAELYVIDPPRASVTWRCPFCSTLLGVLLNLIFGPMGPEPDSGREPSVSLTAPPLLDLHRAGRGAFFLSFKRAVLQGKVGDVEDARESHDPA